MTRVLLALLIAAAALTAIDAAADIFTHARGHASGFAGSAGLYALAAVTGFFLGALVLHRYLRRPADYYESKREGR